ncbi:MAG: DUF4093 domain-containing protein [Oscillospiraceae bacterium]|nr:DUF4093 domain-containing protein [Oscillospiraceae bacterium]
MIRVRQAIIVEGRYDKNTLSQLVDAPIFTTDGFGILSDKEKLAFFRRVAETRGIIILTDPDGAGFLIRNYLKGALPRENVWHAYIPDIYGKERRKSAPGKEGKLGVEGMDAETLLRALRESGALTDEAPPREPITHADLYELGLSGKKDSAGKRQTLLAALCLPSRMSTNAMLDAVNLLYGREEFFRICKETL